MNISWVNPQMAIRRPVHGFRVDFENLKCCSINVSSFSNEGKFHSKPDIHNDKELLKNVVKGLYNTRVFVALWERRKNALLSRLFYGLKKGWNGQMDMFHDWRLSSSKRVLKWHFFCQSKCWQILCQRSSSHFFCHTKSSLRIRSQSSPLLL